MTKTIFIHSNLIAGIAWTGWFYFSNASWW